MDEAARLLAVGPTNLRRIAEAVQRGDNPPTDALDWSRTVYPIEQRLQLLLPADHPVVERFREVRQRLAAISEPHVEDAEPLIVSFEEQRTAFLDAARDAIHAPIPDEE